MLTSIDWDAKEGIALWNFFTAARMHLSTKFTHSCLANGINWRKLLGYCLGMHLRASNGQKRAFILYNATLLAKWEAWIDNSGSKRNIEGLKDYILEWWNKDKSLARKQLNDGVAYLYTYLWWNGKQLPVNNNNFCGGHFEPSAGTIKSRDKILRLQVVET